MRRWYFLTAALAVCAALCGPAAAQIQHGMSSPVGATRMTEPLRYVPEEQPYLVPGPVNPLIAPPGPPPSLNLPSDHTGAFQLNHPPAEEAFYTYLGAISLKRQDLRSRGVVYNEFDGNIDQQDGQVASLVLDAQNFPAGTFTERFNTRDLNQQYNTGFSAWVGYLLGDQSIELGGWWLPAQSTSASFTDQGRLRVPFYPANVFPRGFEGNNGIFSYADQVTVRHTSQIGNVEFNYRNWSSGINRAELVLGLRYFHMQERLDLYSNDELFVTNIFGANDAARIANYSAGVRNNILAAQMGGEYSIPFPGIDQLSWIWFTASGKGGVGPNFVERTLRLTRGDGFAGPIARTNTVRVSGVYEGAFTVDISFLEKLKLRAGYMGVFAVNVATADRAVDFNITGQGARKVEMGNVFYHGPTLELHFLF